MPVDFNNKEFAEPDSDPYGFVHDRETDIRAVNEVRLNLSDLSKTVNKTI